MHHILAYSAANAFGAAEVDTAAIVDPSFTVRNSHFIFTEQYGLIAAAGIGPNLTDARLSSPGIDAVAPARIYPALASTNPAAVQTVMDMRAYPMSLPLNEEIKALLSNNAGAGTDQDSLFLFVAPPTYNLQLPQGIRRQILKTSQSVTGVAYGWSADTALAFSDASPRGGWWYVLGGAVIGTNVIAWRLNFPRQQLVNGRKLFPGALALSSYSGAQLPPLWDMLGVWGSFHTFEPPLLSSFASAAGAQTVQLLLDAVYMGDVGAQPPVMGA